MKEIFKKTAIQPEQKKCILRTRTWKLIFLTSINAINKKNVVWVWSNLT